jgi:hypothetical protein
VVAIDQALISAFISGAFGLPIAHENIDYAPTAGTAYAELLVLQNDVTPATLANSNDTDGVFRVILRYPANSGAVAAKVKADAIFNVFAIGQRLTYSGVTVTVLRNSRQPGVAEEGWYTLVLDMPYRANIVR